MLAPSQRRSTRSSRPLVLVAVIAAVAIIGGTGAAAALTGTANGIEIDGLRPTASELDAALVRAERSGGSETDAAAIETLRDDLALFAVAREVGATDVSRPADISDVLGEVNRQRAEAAAAGEVLYGPVEYDERSFYGKALTDIRQATLERLDAGAADTDITDADVRARFEAEPENWAEAATTLRLDAVTGSGTAPVTADWSALVGAGTTSVREWTARDLESGVAAPEVVADLLAAADGDVVGPFAEAGGWTALRVISRTTDADAAFEHYRTRIRAVLVEERLGALVSQARSEQDVVLR